jgi:hypothetical protein
MTNGELEEIGRKAVDFANEVADSMFDEHVQRMGVMTEGDRRIWTHGFIAGFGSGFVTAVRQTDQVVKNTINLTSKVTQPGEN